MSTFDKSYTTSYWSAIVSIALFCTIYELLDGEKCCGLERSVKVIGNDIIR